MSYQLLPLSSTSDTAAKHHSNEYPTLINTHVINHHKTISRNLRIARIYTSPANRLVYASFVHCAGTLAGA